MKSVTTVVYDFGSFRLHPTERLLLKDGEPVPLTPKAFDLRASKLVVIDNWFAAVQQKLAR